MKKNILYIFIVIIFVILGMWYFVEERKIDSTNLINKVSYNCSGNKTIEATFYKGETEPVSPGEPPIHTGSVKLILSDGRNFDLQQTISADGGRYANGDESFIFWSKGDTAFINEDNKTTFSDCILNSSKTDSDNQISINLANPASENCIKKGGKIEIRKNKIGEYGVCFFEDNRQCEEWALFRGQCPVGGLKITGYDTEAEIYCAITGGKVEGVGTPTPMCKRIDGTYCTVQANLDGDCPNPNNTNPNAGNTETP